jgi:hypothetical protein
MNTKSFAIGFAAMDSIIAGVSATKRSIVHAAKSTAHGAQVSAQATKTGALNTSEAVTSFFAGAKQAVKCRRGSCRMLTHDVRSNEE